MKPNETSTWRKAVQIFASFALVFSMIPICATQNAQVATADEEGSETPETWYYYSSIYPEYEAKNKQEAIEDVDVFVSENIKYTEGGKDIYSKFVDYVGDVTYSDGSERIFKEGTAKLDGKPSFTSSGVGAVTSSNDSAVRIDVVDGKSYPVIVGGSDKPLTIDYILGTVVDKMWKLGFKVTGKSAKSDADEDVSVNAQINYGNKDETGAILDRYGHIIEKDGKFNGTTIDTAGCVSDSGSIFNLDPIKTITEVKDVQEKDKETLENFFKGTGIDTSFTGVEFETDLSDIGLIYKDYKMVPVNNDDWSAAFDKNKLKVTKKRADATTDSLTLTFYAGDTYKDDKSNMLCQITDKENIKENSSTKDKDALAILGAVRDASLDLSFVGDEKSVDFTQTFPGNYSIELDQPYSDYYSATIEKGKLTFKRIKMGWPSGETDTHQIKFKVYWQPGEGSDREYLNNDGFIVNEVNQVTRDNDAKVVADTLNNKGNPFEVTFGQKDDLVISFKNMIRDDYLISNTNNDYYSCTYDSKNKQLRISPKKASASQSKKVILTFYVNSGDKPAENNQLVVAELKVIVKQAKLTVGSIGEMDYRYKSDQLTELKKDENINKLLSYTDKDGTKHQGTEFVKTVEITNYPADGKELTADAKDAKLKFVLKDDVKTNYTIGNTQGVSETEIAFTVKAIVVENADKLTITGTRGDGKKVNPIGDVWASKDIKIKYGSHQIYETTLPKTTNDFTDTVEPKDKNDGKKITTIFAKNTATNVVTKIKDVKFNIDSTAPVVTRMSVDYDEATNENDPKIAEEKNNKGIISKIYRFFFGENKTYKIDMIVSDGQEEGTVAGFEKGAGVKVNYKNGSNNEAKDLKLQADKESSSKHISDNFDFEMSGTEDVRTDSIKVTMSDRAGNEAKDVTPQSQIPSEVMQLIKNGNKPTVSIDLKTDGNINGSYYTGNSTVTVTITEDYFEYMKEYKQDTAIITYKVDGQPSYIYPKTDGWNHEGGTTWTYKLYFEVDADYEVYSQFKNLAEESSNSEWVGWTIDNSSPTVGIIWDNDNVTNGNYYAASRTASVTINEHNFDASMFQVEPTGNGGNASEYGAPSVSDWTHDGDSHQCHVYFPGQGNYSMTVTGEDCAKNALETLNVSEFVVDTIQPEITVSVNGETDAASHAYPDNANVSVAINDTNVDSSSQINVESISWNGNGTPYAENRGSSATSVTVDMPNPENKPESDGVYRVTINAQDLAGNTQTKTVDWSVNRFGSTYVVSDSTKGIITKKYVKSKDMSDVAITEINPSGVNADSATVKVARGTNTQTIQKGQGFTFAEASEANGWPAFTYTISKDKYSSDAMYQTIVSSTDSAGRASDNTMADKSNDRKNSCDVSFAVDNTAPIVSFTGFEDGIVAGREHTVNAYIEDNMKLDHAVVEVNGIEVQSLDDSDLSDKDHQITLYESGDTQKLTIKAYDAAGNVCNIDSSDIFINNDPLARLMHNTVLFVSLLVGGLVLIGALVWYFFFYKRRKDEEEQQA